jgi:hypothetical protein
LGEYAVLIPSPGPFTSSVALLDEVAELVFGPEVVNQWGSIDSMYRDCCKVLANRVWEQMVRKLKRQVPKSEDQCAKMELLMAGECSSI